MNCKAALNRVVTAKNGITLSTGHHLPHKAVIGFGNPYHPLSDSPKDTIYHAAGQESLTTFNPWRFSEMRDLPDEANKHQYTTVDLDNIAWGYGRNVCPGRFFAGNTMKCILVEMLRRYDMGVGPNGEGESEEYPRPRTMERGWSYAPDPDGAIWVKSRASKPNERP